MSRAHLTLIRCDDERPVACPVAPAMDGYNCGHLSRWLRDTAEAAARSGRTTVEIGVGTARLVADLVDLGAPAA